MQSSTAEVAVVIPAYRPGATLVALVDALLDRGVDTIIVVDDGSGPAFASLYEGIARHGRVHILHHAVNLGKGAALKTGLNYALAEIPGVLGVVTADADGQLRLFQALGRSRHHRRGHAQHCKRDERRDTSHGNVPPDIRGRAPRLGAHCNTVAVRASRGAARVRHGVARLSAPARRRRSPWCCRRRRSAAGDGFAPRCGRPRA